MLISRTGFAKARKWLNEIVEWQLILDSRVADNAGTVRETLVSLIGKAPDPHILVNGKKVSLAGPIEELGDYQLWASAILTIFLDLSKQRGRSQGGVVPISFTDIEVYLRLNAVELSPLEIDVLIDLDQTFISEVSRQLNEEMNRIRT